EKVVPDQLESAVSEYAHESDLFVIAHGGEYVDALQPIALMYPQIKFAVVGRYPGNGRNYGSISTGNGFCYLAGVIAAMKSRSGHISAIFGKELTHLRAQYDAYVSGAKFINNDIKVSAKYVGSWDDQPLALKLAAELMDVNSDVMLVNLDYISPAVHRLATERGIKTISITTDERKDFPNTVLAALLTDFSKQMSAGIKLFLQGKWEGKLYRFGLSEGVTFVELQENVLDENQRASYDRIFTNLIQKQIALPELVE
ncbi:MAG: BMP family ABC transporter substrate-binding protein, partial [Candidatus Cloacimonadaceae bacterium]|nr:BMP family ABC transporter substrate-binding protein [Candidatus Cloacimonadaceae bacterium]